MIIFCFIQNAILKSSERLYQVNMDGRNKTLLFVNATGGIYVQPFQSLGEAQFLFTKYFNYMQWQDHLLLKIIYCWKFVFNRQTFQLKSIKKLSENVTFGESRGVTIQHELPENDLTQGRGTPDKESIFQSVKKNCFFNFLQHEK